MRRLLEPALTALILMMSVEATQAGGSAPIPFYSTTVPVNPQFWPQSWSQPWPAHPRAPAIAKTFGQALPMPQPSAPHSRPQHAPNPPAYHYEQPRPPSPDTRFSHPQQGYFPREGFQNQQPGYEYEYETGPGYGSQFPMEGAAWRTYNRGPHYRATGFGQYLDCPRY